tara:strand:- start:533 stop:763 length:231 start_codon:yes stop_codon:yes gene_type:complete
MLKLISIPIFLISLAIGLFLVYLREPEYKNVYIYPNPDNINKYQWMDNANNCYEWKQSDILCPDNPEQISQIPLQN